jgi:hypothetical protein
MNSQEISLWYLKMHYFPHLPPWNNFLLYRLSDQFQTLIQNHVKVQTCAIFVLMSLWCNCVMFAEHQQILQHQWRSCISILIWPAFSGDAISWKWVPQH